MGDRGIPHNTWLRTIEKTGDRGVYLCHEIVINKAKSLMHNLWRLLNNNSVKTKERIDYNFKSWPLVFQNVYRWELDSFLVSQTLGPRRQNARYSDQFFFVFGHEVFAWSVPYSWHNKISNIHWSVPCCFYSIGFGNFRCVPCFVDNRLSGCWRSRSLLISYHLLRRVLRISAFSVRYRFCRVRIRSLFSA